jgi:hypothetical protein
MKIKIITSENEAPLDREMTELGKTLADEGADVETYLWEDEESDGLKALYDIYQSPAVLVVADNGSLTEIWQGTVPTESELRYRCGNV